MLSVVALKNFGTGGAAVLSRQGRRGEVLRVGGGVRDQLRLAGCNVSSDFFFDGRAWQVRFADGAVRRVGDGDGISLGDWHVTLLLDDELAAIAPRSVAESTWFEGDGRAPLPIITGVPALVGTARWCSVRLSEAELPTIAIVRRNLRCETWLYTIPGISILVNGQLVRDSIRLGDGAVIELWSASVRRPIRYRDPCEEIDRILGAIADPAAPCTNQDRPQTSIVMSLRRLIGTGPHALLRPDEAATIAVVAAVVIGFGVLMAVQW